MFFFRWAPKMFNTLEYNLIVRYKCYIYKFDNILLYVKIRYAGFEQRRVWRGEYSSRE